MKRRGRSKVPFAERMRSKRRVWAAVQRREQLVALITERDGAGNYKCAECKCGWFAASDIEIDHVDGITWDDRKVNSGQRIERFHAEHAAGVRLRGLCKSCNSRDGVLRGWRNGVYERKAA